MANPPPQLHDLIARIYRELETMRAALATIQAEVEATRTALAKRRLPTQGLKSETPEEIALAMQAALDRFFTDLAKPIQLHHLACGFTRRIASAGLTTRDIISLMPNVHTFSSGSGGSLLYPRDQWEQLTYARQQYWLGITPKEMKKERLKEVAAVEKLYDNTKGMTEAIPAEASAEPFTLGEILPPTKVDTG